MCLNKPLKRKSATETELSVGAIVAAAGEQRRTDENCPDNFIGSKYGFSLYVDTI